MTSVDEVLDSRWNVSEVDLTESLFDLLLGLVHVGLELRVGDGRTLMLYLVLRWLSVNRLVLHEHPDSIIDLINCTVHVVKSDFLADVPAHALHFVHIVEVLDSLLLLESS